MSPEYAEEALTMIYGVVLVQEQATNPGIALTILTALVAALAGAGAAGLITHRLTFRRERLKEEAEKRKIEELEEREKVGLLKLVHAEVTNNLEYLKEMGIGQPMYMITKRGPDNLRARGLKSDAWEQSRTRLADLVEDERHFEHLVSCYGALAVLKDRLLHPDMDDLSQEYHEAQVQSVTSRHWLAFEVCCVETGRFRAWNKGMLVSKPNSKPSQLVEESEELDESQDLESPPATQDAHGSDQDGAERRL